MVKGAICFGAQDAPFAMEIAQHLKLQTSLELQPAEAKRAEHFLDLVEQCLSEKFVLVVLSTASVPKLWRREEWERVLVECAKESATKVAYVQRGACPFPPLLKKRGFFDFSADAAVAGTGLRRWVIEGFGDRIAPRVGAGQALESLLSLVDHPLFVRDVKRSQAEWLVSNHWRDFQNVYWVECGSWTRAGILGETAHVAGLKLTGTVDENLEAIRSHAQSERALYVFEYLTEEFVELAELGGRASVVVLAESERESVTLAKLKMMFGGAGVDEAACLRALGCFVNVEENPGGWNDLKPIGLRAVSFFRNAGRMAEAHEFLVWFSAQAVRNEDSAALKMIRWEQSWILESWGIAAAEPVEVSKAEPVQMGLFGE